ncbi:hypothetical protein [Myroides odoratus]|uniref:hypothetical protein n=1 Tax=Myroides odoratus TaxID=256 RepID=UPI000765B581|nr:hypothetical protein [Myroides odoratus]
MKQLYLIVLGVVALCTACHSDQATTDSANPAQTKPTIYEHISATYEKKQQELPNKTTAGFWGWLKKVASADAKAAAAYAVKKGMKSDWKEALLISAAASVGEAITVKKSIQSAQNTTEAEPYHTLVLSNIQQIKTAEFSSNTMDDAGYYHYVLVNEVLKDSMLSTIPPNELFAMLYDKIYQQAEQLGLQAPYEKEEAVALLEKINQVADNESDAYYATLYPFENKEDFAHFKPIAKIYTTTFYRLNNTALFTAYSKEMEAAVLADATLSQQVKDVLLLEMATYRFGNTYYFSKF